MTAQRGIRAAARLCAHERKLKALATVAQVIPNAAAVETTAIVMIRGIGIDASFSFFLPCDHVTCKLKSHKIDLMQFADVFNHLPTMREPRLVARFLGRSI